MKLYYFESESGNFGDDLNPWLWERLVPGFFDESDEILFIGIGTLLNHRVPDQPKKVVFGSGAGYGKLPKIDSSWDFSCVRGPLTAELLGLPSDLAVTDAAALVGTLPLPKVDKDGGVAFMPHVTSAENADWAAVCKDAGLRYIDPRWCVERVLGEISKSQLVVAEAMHGAIISDTLRVPWIPVTCYPHISSFKWRDWTGSLDLDYSPRSLDGVWDVERILSPDKRLKNNVKRWLGGIQMAPAGMTPPPPRKSSRQQFERLIDQLSDVARNGSPRLSDGVKFNDAVLRLQERLDLIRRKYAS